MVHCFTTLNYTGLCQIPNDVQKDETNCSVNVKYKILSKSTVVIGE